MAPETYMKFEDKQYLSAMLKHGWKCYIYKIHGFFVPSGVQWNDHNPLFIVYPKIAYKS